jgi:hypothetical protein
VVLTWALTHPIEIGQAPQLGRAESPAPNATLRPIRRILDLAGSLVLGAERKHGPVASAEAHLRGASDIFRGDCEDEHRPRQFKVFASRVD